MSKDLLSFTKQISGIDLVDYVVNFIDQNMIAYKILKNIDHDIVLERNDTSLIYNMSNLTIDEINEIRNFPTEDQNISIFNTLYRVSFSMPDNNKFIISIKLI